MLRGSVLTRRRVRAVWDLSVSSRRGDGLHKGTGQDPRAQRQTWNARENLRWVNRNWAPSALLPCSLLTEPSSPLSLPSVFCKSHTSSSIRFLNDAWLGFLRLLVSIDRFLFWLLIGWLQADASWDTKTGQMSVMSPGQRLQQHTHQHPNAEPIRALHTHPSDMKQAIMKYVVNFLLMWLFLPPEWFCFEKDPGRAHVTPASLRAPMNRWTRPLRASHLIQHRALPSWSAVVPFFPHILLLNHAKYITAVILLKHLLTVI